MDQPLTYDEIADIYDKTTGKKARANPIPWIIDWAMTVPDVIRYDKEQDLFFKG